MTAQSALRALTVLLTVVALGVPRAGAQTATATLSGAVRDESGGAVPGASVAVTNPATGAQRRTLTSADGRYVLSNLEPGEYELRVESTGFRSTVHRGLALTVGGSAVADVTLQIGQLAEEVTVDTEEPLVETAKTDLSRVVGAEEIESLPNAGRNFVDFVKLSSGVAPGRENVGGGPFKEADTGIGPAAAPRLSFGGQSELYTMIQVDGADNIQTFTGLPRATPSQEAAKEFRVLNSTYLAEYGRALGGFVNIVTKSGTNTVQGSAYYYGMNDALASRSILSRPEADELSQHQYGATLGGPLRRDATFYFLNYEGQRRKESNRFSQVILDNLDTLNTVRARFGLRPETLDQVRSNDYDQFLVKLDHRLGGSHTVSARYNYLNSEALNFPGGGGRASPASSSARNNETRDHSAVANLISVLSRNVVNEARVQWASRSYEFLPIASEPALEISNLILMGKTTSDIDYYRERRVQLSDSLLLARGAHQFKLGTDVNMIKDEAVWNLFFPARIIFPTLGAFTSFTPAVFWWPSLKVDAVHPGFSTAWDASVPSVWGDDTQFQMDHSSVGFFVQDQWKATGRLTLSLGVRYDFESYPERYITKKDRNNIQPRLGIGYAYSPRGVIRAGYGRFTDRIGTSVGQVFNTIEWSSRGDLANARVLFPDLSLVPGRFYQNTVGGPAAPGAALTFLTTGRPPAATRTGLTDALSADLSNPYSHQASVQVSQEVGGGLALSASYLFVRAQDLIGHTGNLNAVRTGTLPTGKPTFGGRAYPELGDFFVADNLLWSQYHGGTFEVQKRFRGGVGFHASYTLSRTRSNGDSVTNLGDFPENPDGLEAGLEEARSRQDVTHRFTLSFLSQVPKSVPILHDFRFNSLVSFESGRYFTVYAGRDANLDGNPNSDRAGNLGRNTLQGPAFFEVNLRVGREIALSERVRTELTADVFNVFNRTNVKDLNTNYGGFDLAVAPAALLGFNSPRDVFNPRQVQLAVKLKF